VVFAALLLAVLVERSLSLPPIPAASVRTMQGQLIEGRLIAATPRAWYVDVGAGRVRGVPTVRIARSSVRPQEQGRPRPLGSRLPWTGWWSQVHKYPAQQRFYTITSEAGRGDRPGVDVVHTPTSDGVNAGIEGTLYFTLTLDHAALKTFDNKFGTRKFRSVDG